MEEILRFIDERLKLVSAIKPQNGIELVELRGRVYELKVVKNLLLEGIDSTNQLLARIKDDATEETE